METGLPSRFVEPANTAMNRIRFGKRRRDGRSEPGIIMRGVRMITHRVSLRVLAFTVGAIMAAGTGSGLGQIVAKAATPEAVVIRDFSFTPATITVAPGTEVTWTNQDNEPHRVVNAADPKLFQSAALDTNDKYSFKFDKQGTYRYFCSIHPRMTGTIVVK
jgi:plastocyanin